MTHNCSIASTAASELLFLEKRSLYIITVNSCPKMTHPGTTMNDPMTVRIPRATNRCPGTVARWPVHIHAIIPISMILCLVWIPIGMSRANGPFQKTENQLQDGPSESIFVPAPRELARPFEHARQAVADQRYREAVQLLGELLTDQSHEDFLIPSPEHPYKAMSLHREAQKLLGQVPSRFRDDYELKYSVEARQMLEQAIAQSDFVEMAKVFRHYFYTDAGFSAAMLLGQHYLEMGEPISASAYFAEIVRQPDARRNHDPAASILLATCWLIGNQPDRAEMTLIDFQKRWPQSSIRFMGDETRLFEDDSDALTWLVKLIGDSPIGQLKQVDQWLVFRGNAQRNAQSGTGFPLSFARWQVPTINDPEYERIAREVFEERLANDQPLIPSVQPLAVGDTIILRSLDRMVGVDFKTGKRIWEYPAWQQDTILDTRQKVRQLRNDRTDASHIEQRLWNDHLYGQSCSNGELIFVIDQPGFASANAENQAVLRQGFLAEDPLGNRGSNELKAVELSREGAFRWQVGGPTGGVEPKLKDCFFLGPPLPMNGRLYALCEISSELRLVVLDDSTGRLVWSQQIAAIDLIQPGERDPNRRLAGASPSFSDGILICPTTASGIVAIELATRSLLWGVQYPSIYNAKRDGGKINQLHISSSRSKGMAAFADASVTIYEGNVVVMPAESKQLFCFDLLTGQPKWNSQWSSMGIPRNDALYIACVEGGTILLVGNQTTRGVSIQDGSILWQLEHGDLGKPTGRGYRTNGSYYLPMSSATIAQIDMESGSFTETIKTDQVLGNLICFGSDVVSHGFDTVTTFRQAKPSRELVTTAEQSGNWSPEIRRLSAQLLKQDGNLLDATRVADSVYQEENDPKSARLLFGLILDLMQSDYAAAAPFVDRYKDDLAHVGGGRFITSRIEGLIGNDDAQGAIETLVDMALDVDTWLNSREAIRDVNQFDGGKRLIRVDHWIQSQIDQVISGSGVSVLDEDRSGIFASVDRKLDQADHRALTRVADWIGIQNLPARKRLELAIDLRERKYYVEAERELTILAQATDDQLAGEATAQLVTLFDEAGWTESARLLQNELATRFAETIVLGNQTGREFANSVFDDSPHLNLDWNEWPQGELISVPTRRARTEFATRGIEFPKRKLTSGISPDWIQIEVSTQNYQATIRDATGQVMGTVSFVPEDQQRIYVTSSIMFGEYALIGHMLVLYCGTELIGVDLFKLRAGENALAWQHTFNPKRPDDESSRSVFGRVKTQNVTKWGESRVYVVDAYQNPISGFAANENGQVFFRVHDTIKCIDAFDGHVVWQRKEIEPTTTLTATNELVHLIRRENPDKILSFDARTGMETGQLPLASDLSRHIWYKSGDLVLFTTSPKPNQLELYDISRNEVIWSETLSASALGTIIENDCMAVYEKNGRLRYFDLQNGHVKFDTQLPARHRAENLRILRLQKHDLIILNKIQYRTRIDLSNFDVQGVNRLDNMIDGYLTMIDRETGERVWPTDVYVENFCLPPGHPPGLPLLVLSRTVNHMAENKTARFNEFYTIDLRNGRLANRLSLETRNAYSMHVQYDLNATTEIVSGTNVVHLHFDETDLPPAAPASLTNEFTLENTTKKVNEKIAAERSPLQEALERLRNNNGGGAFPDRN